MVVDKDMEGRSQRRVGMYTYCTALQMECSKLGMSAKLVNFLCTGRIMIAARLDMICWGTTKPLAVVDDGPQKHLLLKLSDQIIWSLFPIPHPHLCSGVIEVLAVQQ